LTTKLLAMPRRRSTKTHFTFVLLPALLLRLVVAYIVLFVYPRNWLFSKAPDLGYLAHSLATGRGLGSPFGGATGPSAFVAPGYPTLLAAIFRIFGSYTFAAAATIIGLQTLFALLTILALMRVARATLGANTANLAGVFWSISPPLLWLPVILWETSLSILLMTVMAALALRGAGKAGNAFWLMTGAYCGSAMLVNPSLMLALCSMLVWAAYRSGCLRSGKPWLALVGLIVVFAPWPLRNARVLHAFIPLRSNFGYEIWQGNHQGSDGLFDATIEPLQNKKEYAEYASLGEVAYMRQKTALAAAYIRAHPTAFLRLCARRVIRFWTGTGSRENSGAIALFASLTSFLGLAGLTLLFRQRHPAASLFLVPLLLFPLPYYLTHPDFRFRLVLDPLLTILTAHTVLVLRGRIARGLRA
jgi:hypothetical protein